MLKKQEKLGYGGGKIIYLNLFFLFLAFYVKKWRISMMVLTRNLMKLRMKLMNVPETQFRRSLLGNKKHIIGPKYL